MHETRHLLRPRGRAILACALSIATSCATPPPTTPEDGGAHGTDASLDAAPPGDAPPTDGAAPDAPSVDGGEAPLPADDAEHTLRGEGFGENAFDDQLWMGGRHGTIETAEVGHDITRDDRWASDTRGNGVTEITDADAWSHAHAIAADSTATTMGWDGIFDASYDTGVHISRVLVRYMVRWDDLGATALENMQWKMLRLCYGPFVSDGAVPNVLLSNWIGQVTWGRQGGDVETSWLEPTGMPRPDGTWYAVEIAVVVNAPLAEANGTFELRVRRMRDRAIVGHWTEEGVQYIAPSDPNGYFQWLVFQNYQGNLMDGTGVEPDENPSRILMDDVYALTGGSGAYVVVGNAPRWSDVTHEEVQAVDRWTDTEIHIPHLNLARFEPGEALYLYVKTSPSTVSREEGYPL